MFVNEKRSSLITLSCEFEQKGFITFGLRQDEKSMFAIESE
jgi:hypothetical protein